MDINQTLENLRVNYRKAALDIGDCDLNPEVQFDKWLEDAVQSKCDEPNAFVISTCVDNRPRARVVLLKGIHEGEFVFYTNYESAKGRELEQNPHVAMTFLWLPLQRQIRIEGVLKKAQASLSDEYFHKRPRGNQLGALASPQSRKVASRDILEKMFHETEQKFLNEKELDRPAHWGGYTVKPSYFEFWQGRDSRMHDRIIYEQAGKDWNLSRLAP